MDPCVGITTSAIQQKELLLLEQDMGAWLGSPTGLEIRGMLFLSFLRKFRSSTLPSVLDVAICIFW